MVKDIKDKRKRRRHPVDEKAAVLRRHLVDKYAPAREHLPRAAERRAS